MAAVTAAVIGATATLAATGASVAGSMSQGGGGTRQPNIKQVPEDPQDEAMKNYYSRALVANATKTYPAFNEYLQSGGDPAKARFDLDMPAMKPSEAAAFGFVGGKGERIPGVSQEALAAGDITSLTPEQRIYLAKERAGKAAAAGQKPGPWAGRMQKLGGRIGRLENVLETKFTPTPEVEPREARIQAKLERLRGKREDLTMKGDQP